MNTKLIFNESPDFVNLVEIISELQAVELLKATGFEAGQNTMILPFSPLGVVMAQGLNTDTIP